MLPLALFTRIDGDMSGRELIIAKNPEACSRLPFLLCVPLPDADLWLKAKEAWPRDTRVYCHPLSATPALEQLEILERIPVAHCSRRGLAIDLVLARALNKRSQFVFAAGRGRTVILWQTARAARSARPGLRIPSGKSAQRYVYYVDTRERFAYSFSAHGCVTEARRLPAGDYAAIASDKVIGVVERKSLGDFATSLVGASLALQEAELATFPLAAIVVEGTYSALLRHEHVRAGLIPELVARLQVRYPQVPIMFLESRKMAEEWTYRFLHCAYVNAESLLQ